jgi:methylamine dehydrogenase heavy chain
MRPGHLFVNPGKKRISAAAAFSVAALAAACLLPAVAVAAEEFQPERLKDGVSLPADLIPMYVSDFSLGHLMDGRVYVMDARNGRYAGVIDAGYAGQFALSPDGKEAYVAATYLSRHSHGERNDVLEFYDTSTLRLKSEIILPRKHVQGLFTKELMRTSPNGRYLYVQNATPATSVTVVDLQQHKVLTEVTSPGCWALYPSQTSNLRFSMLCGDGTLNTVTLNEDGSIASRAPSSKFFDSDSDPVYITAVDDGESYYFLSFKGRLIKATLSGEQPVIGASRELVSGKERKQGWRPGGYQLMTLQRSSGKLFLTMHPDGKEGSHKFPGKEIWEIDLGSGKLLARHKASNATTLSVSPRAPGYLYALDGSTNRIHSYDLGRKFRQVYVSEPIGEAPAQVDTP